MDLMYMNHDREDLGVLKNPEFDLAFGEDENNFECKISLKDHCCKEGYYIYAEGTEYGGIVDAIEIDSENDLAIYTGRSWHGILASKVIEPLKASDKTEITVEVEHKSRLPKGFTELESITSTGTQFVDIDFYPTSKSRIVMTAQFSQTQTQAALFGSRRSSNEFRAFFNTSGDLAIRHGSSQSYYVDCVATEKNTFDYNQNTLTVNYSSSVTAPEVDFSVPYSCYLFATNNAGSLLYPASFTLFECYAYDVGVLKRHLVPCKNPESKIGLFDLVSSKFFGNAGTGEFIAGAETENAKTEVIAKAETKDIDNNSLINRYLSLSGDVGGCVKYIVERINLAPFFTAFEKLADVEIERYTFERYIDAYSGLRDMLATCGMRLAMVCEENTVKLSAVPIFDGSHGKEMESDLIEYQMKKTYNSVNHLICMGNGSYADRQIVHLYLDENGNVSETQTFTGIEERIQFDGEQGEPEEEETRTAEQLAEERAQLIENGTKKLLNLQAEDEIDVTFDSADDIYYVGDIVGAYDSTTDISVAAEVVKKIISISRGRANIEYKVGARNG